MKRKPRIYYTDEQKALMWERWRKGESLQHIAQLFGRSHRAIQGILVRTGFLDSPLPSWGCLHAVTLQMSNWTSMSRSSASGLAMVFNPSNIGRCPCRLPNWDCLFAKSTPNCLQSLYQYLNLGGESVTITISVKSLKHRGNFR